MLQRYRLELLPNSRINRYLSITMAPRPGVRMRIHEQDRAFRKSARSVRGNVREMVDFAN
jgi:hypothetical protein